MSKNGQEQPVRVARDTAVTGLCFDCGKNITGHIGVRFVMIGNLAGIEVLVCTEKDMHLLARVQLKDVPMVRLTDVNPRVPTRE